MFKLKPVFFLVAKATGFVAFVIFILIIAPNNTAWQEENLDLILTIIFFAILYAIKNPTTQEKISDFDRRISQLEQKNKTF